MRRRARVAVVVLTLGALLVACGDDDGSDVRDTPSSVSGTGTATGSGSGSVAASGSASGSVAVPGSGSGSGSPSGPPACEAIGDAASATATVAVRLDEYVITTDATRIPAGTIRFSVDNVGSEQHELVIVADVPAAELPLDDRGALDEAALPAGALIGELEPFSPGVICDGTFELEAGEYTLVCNVVADGRSHLHEGMVSELTVTAA